MIAVVESYTQESHCVTSTMQRLARLSEKPTRCLTQGALGELPSLPFLSREFAEEHLVTPVLPEGRSNASFRFLVPLLVAVVRRLQAFS